MSITEDRLRDLAIAIGTDIKDIKDSMGFFNGLEITDAIETDLLQYTSGKWRNIRKEVISDGGNF